MNQKPFINRDYKHLGTLPGNDAPKKSVLASKGLYALMACGLILGIVAVVFARPYPANNDEEHTTANALPPVALETTLIKPEKPDTTTANSANEPTANDAWRTVTVKRGDSLATTLNRAGIDAQQVHEIVSLDKDTQKLKKLFPGDTFKIQIDNTGKLAALHFEFDEASRLEITRQPSGLTSKVIALPLERRIGYAHGTIDSSLFLAAQNVGLPDKTTLELAEIFGWDIDFALDIQPGDSFSVLFEEFYRDGKQLRIGNIVAAEFTNQGKTHKAIRFEDDFGARYYGTDGSAMRKAFLRTPVEFSRISSTFNKARKHPVLNIIRAHKGVDYAAPTGTPIRVTGDGKVIFKGDRGGYGNTIIVQHANNYTTLYAHLSRYASNLRQGQRVEQGQVIGYLGSSGLATGPHLHYEFRINDIHRDPLKVQLPKSLPLEKKYVAKFNKVASEMLATLDSYKQTQLALGAAQ